MDKWKDIELEKMKVGGNQRAREFFEDQPDWHENQTIQQRYNSRAAALYRDKIATLAAGKPWSEETSSAKNHSSVGMGSQHSSSSSMHQSKSVGSLSSSANYQQSDGGYQQFNTQEFKDQKEEFFGRKQAENMARPENLPPSQGGRYAGFGNTVAPPPKSQSQEFFDTTLSSLASGWSLFSSTASKVAETAKEKAFEYGNIASQKV